MMGQFAMFHDIQKSGNANIDLPVFYKALAAPLEQDVRAMGSIAMPGTAPPSNGPICTKDT